MTNPNPKNPPAEFEYPPGWTPHFDAETGTWYSTPPESESADD